MLGVKRGDVNVLNYTNIRSLIALQNPSLKQSQSVVEIISGDAASKQKNLREIEI
jgi:hypothetical protein